MTVKLRVDVDVTSLLEAKLAILEMQAPPAFDLYYMAQVAMARMDCYINARAKAHLLAFHVCCLVTQARPLAEMFATERLVGGSTTLGTTSSFGSGSFPSFCGGNSLSQMVPLPPLPLKGIL